MKSRIVNPIATIDSNKGLTAPTPKAHFTRTAVRRCIASGKNLGQIKPNSKRESIELMSDGTFKLNVTAEAIDGKANEVVCKLLAEKLYLKKSDVRIVSGKTAKIKQIEVPLSTEEICSRLSGPSYRSMIE